MIRALRACLRRPDLRRVVGLVALVAFLFVVVLGAAHAGEKHDAAHDQCGVCVAAASVATSDSFVVPQLTGDVAETAAVAVRDASIPVAAEPRRSHAPRAPPSLA